MEKLKTVLNFVLDRGKEKSTWISLLGLAGTVLGVTLAPEQAEAIAVAGVSVLAAIGVFMKEA